MKKVLVFILLLITSAAVFFPCCQHDDCLNQTSSTNNQHNHKAGTCSPFVNCGTCCGFTQLASAVEMLTFKPVRAIHYSRVLFVFPSVNKAPLLQPPRIA